VISVSDDGPGITPAEWQMLLAPFTRGEPSRARQTGGAGLGLAIVRTLAEAQGGTVEIGAAGLHAQAIDSTVGRISAEEFRGATVCIRLPLFHIDALNKTQFLDLTHKNGLIKSAASRSIFNPF
jgi:signal transduction histidine kinase